MADLITLPEYKALMDVTGTEDDAHITALLPAVSRAIRSYTGRKFEVTDGVPTSRSFEYDYSGMVDIDDCTAVVSVSTTANIPEQTFTLGTHEWTAMPQDDSDVFYYILVHGGPFGGISPEMGFTRNLDRYPISPYRGVLMDVTATWGWVAVPEDVKLAAALTANEQVSAPDRTEGLTAEAIADWSRSWGRASGGGAVASLAIPNKARDLLSSYQRIYV